MTTFKPKNFAVLKNVEVRYSALNEPREVPGSDELKFQACILIPKDKTDVIEVMKAAIKAAAANVGAKNYKSPLRDGDIEKEGWKIFENRFFINARTKFRPQLLNRDDIIVDEIPYDYNTAFKATVKVNAIGYTVESSNTKGVTIGLVLVKFGSELPKVQVEVAPGNRYQFNDLGALD